MTGVQTCALPIFNDKVQAGMINISCNTAPYFKDGKSEGNVMLVNELNNL